jgi:hypothetical protein
MQVVSGEKIFDEILLFGPINLQVILLIKFIVRKDNFLDRIEVTFCFKFQGKIRSETLERMNPISTIKKNLQLEGDY